MAEKKIKKKGTGFAFVVPKFATDKLALKEGDALTAVVGYNKRLEYGHDSSGFPLGKYTLIKPVGFSSLQINIPKLWVEHHGLTAGSIIDATLGNGCIIITPVQGEGNGKEK
jgi:antitoxin component of MazEF toxin-antitoxin module